MQKTIEQRVEQFTQFYKKENKEHLLGFFLGSEYPLFRYEASQTLPEDRPLTPDDFPVEAYVADSNLLFEGHEACGGDFIWAANAFWGIPWLEAALGCPLKASHSSGSIHSEPPGAGAPGADSSGTVLPDMVIPEFDEQNRWIKKTGEFLDALASASKGRYPLAQYPLATTRMRGVADLLSALYGGEQFVFKLMEAPEQMHRVCEELTRFYIEYGKYQLERIPDFHGGIGSFYYSAWAPAGTVWHQEDSVMLLSPDLYREFILPCDRKIFEAFSGNIMHFHSVGGYIPVEEVLELGPTAVEYHIDAGGPSAEELYDTHMKILKKAPLIIWGEMSKADLDWIFDKLPAEGVAVNTVVASSEEAHDIWERYK